MHAGEQTLGGAGHQPLADRGQRESRATAVGSGGPPVTARQVSRARPAASGARRQMDGRPRAPTDVPVHSGRPASGPDLMCLAGGEVGDPQQVVPGPGSVHLHARPGGWAARARRWEPGRAPQRGWCRAPAPRRAAPPAARDGRAPAGSAAPPPWSPGIASGGSVRVRAALSGTASGDHVAASPPGPRRAAGLEEEGHEVGDARWAGPSACSASASACSMSGRTGSDRPARTPSPWQCRLERGRQPRVEVRGAGNSPLMMLCIAGTILPRCGAGRTASGRGPRRSRRGRCAGPQARRGPAPARSKGTSLHSGGLHHGVGRVARPGNPEVDDLHLAAVAEQHILRRDVTVDDLQRASAVIDAGMGVVQPPAHPHPDLQGDRLGEIGKLERMGPAQDTAQRLSVHVLHGQEVLAVDLAEVEDLRDVPVAERDRDAPRSRTSGRRRRCRRTRENS